MSRVATESVRMTGIAPFVRPAVVWESIDQTLRVSWTEFIDCGSRSGIIGECRLLILIRICAGRCYAAMGGLVAIKQLGEYSSGTVIARARCARDPLADDIDCAMLIRCGSKQERFLA